jgi:hypothetical protein
VVFSQSSPRGKSRSVFSGGQSSLNGTQVSDALQRSGVDLRQLSRVAQESPFSLAQSSSPVDGSFIRPFGLDTGHDVAGWEIWDATSRYGTVILGVNDRLGILIEGSNVTDPNVLLEIASSINYDEAERLLRTDAA